VLHATIVNMERSRKSKELNEFLSVISNDPDIQSIWDYTAKYMKELMQLNACMNPFDLYANPNMLFDFHKLFCKYSNHIVLDFYELYDDGKKNRILCCFKYN